MREAIEFSIEFSLEGMRLEGLTAPEPHNLFRLF